MRRRGWYGLILITLAGSLLLSGSSRRAALPGPSTWGDWAALRAWAGPDAAVDMAALEKLVSIDEARFLFTQLAALPQPAALRDLAGYQARQNAGGGGFYGFLPEQLTDRAAIPVPDGRAGQVRAALFLARVRQKNRQAIAAASDHYPLEFKSIEFPAWSGSIPAGMGLEINVEDLAAVVTAYQAGPLTVDQSVALAARPAFREMLAHRHDLGYIPKPWVTETSLAAFIRQGASRRPLDQLWKWINPRNCFDFADIYLFRNRYAALLRQVKAEHTALAGHILSRLARFVPPGTDFHDRYTFAVGCLVRGWATRQTAGADIEHFKSDTRRLILTMTHELFHRLQLKIGRVDPAHAAPEVRTFDDLAAWPFKRAADRAFYQSLSYIMLEGTATFVADPTEATTAERERKAAAGWALLRRAHDLIYKENKADEAEKLLNEGLRSNGPYYDLGAAMAAQLVARDGERSLGRCLVDGAPTYFARWLATGAHRTDGDWLVATVRRLQSECPPQKAPANP